VLVLFRAHPRCGGIALHSAVFSVYI